MPFNKDHVYPHPRGQSRPNRSMGLHRGIPTLGVDGRLFAGSYGLIGCERY